MKFKADKDRNSSWQVTMRLLLFFKPYYPYLFFTIILSIGIAITTFFNATLLKEIADSAINKDMSMLMRYFRMILLVCIAESILIIFRTYIKGKFVEYSLFSIKEKTASHISRLSISYLDNHPSGDLISRLTNDIGIVQNFLQNNLDDILLSPILFLTAFIYLCTISWKLTLFAIIINLLLMYLVMKLSKPIERHTKEQQEVLAEVNSIAQDSISGLTVVKSFTLENIMDEKFSKKVNESVLKGLKIAIVQAILNPLGTIMGISPFILTFLYGGYLVINGYFTFGGLLSFIQMLNHVVNPITALPKVIGAFRSTVSAISRIFEVWDLPLERETGKSYPIRRDIPVISFRNVSFSYNGNSEVISDLSFDIKEGETIAFVGPSGCGKSTILKLITGFYQPKRGELYIYGVDINEWRLDEVRRFISVVSQDTYLFPESIYINISYGKEGPTREDVINAAKLAGIHNFIQTLPDGYDTLVGERGVKLSGGQKQKVSIARAILKDAPILLLDEPTASLDSESEKQIQESLERLIEGRTTIIVAHRLSTIKNADKILVINEGKIAEIGRHEELIKNNGLYRQLYMNQIESKDIVEA